MVSILASLTMLRIADEQDPVVPNHRSVEANQRLRAVGVPSGMILIPARFTKDGGTRSSDRLAKHRRSRLRERSRQS
jgi:hypothetical protein